MLTFVYHHHFILGMGTMVMWPSHAASRCSSSLKQQPSWWEKRFISVHGPSLMSAWSHRKHRLGVLRQIQYWLELPWSVRIIYSPSAVKPLTQDMWWDFSDGKKVSCKGNLRKPVVTVETYSSDKYKYFLCLFTTTWSFCHLCTYLSICLKACMFIYICIWIPL